MSRSDGSTIGHVATVDQHTAGGRPLQPRDEAQQRGLAAARGTDDDQHLAVGQRQVDAVQNIDQSEALAQAVEFQGRHGRETATAAEAPAIAGRITSPTTWTR